MSEESQAPATEETPVEEPVNPSPVPEPAPEPTAEDVAKATEAAEVDAELNFAIVHNLPQSVKALTALKEQLGGA
jgi:hypothetical protein